MPVKTLAVLALCALAAPSHAQHATPGAIARLAVPAGFTVQYDPGSDVTVLNRGPATQLMLWAGPALPPRDGMNQLLRAFGVQHLAPQVVTSSLAGHDGVRLDAVTTVRERWYVLTLDGASLVVRLASPTSCDDLQDAAAQTVRSVVLAPAAHPPLVAGAYETGVHRSGLGDYGTRDDVAVYAESGVRLLPDGRLQDGGFAGASGGSGTVMGGSAGSGRWEVRGDRLLMVYGDGTAAAFRVQAFTNGLELRDGQGRKLLWVRK